MKFHSKTKSAQKLGYRTSDHFKGRTFNPGKSLKTNLPQRRNQHKG